MTTAEAGRNGTPDDEQLRFAAAMGRCIVTKNVKDFLALPREYERRGLTHAGILLVTRSLPQHDNAGIARALVYYARLHPVDVIRHTDWLHPAPREG